MKKILLFSVLFLQGFAFSQTKLISHKSHSGSNVTFRTALESNLFDIGDSNLGEAPMRLIKNAQLDTVIFVSDEKAVMVTSEYCKDEFRFRINNDEENKKEKDLGELWRAGKDTVVNHPLFSRKHSLDSIKNVLKNEYHFQNDIEKVVFIGYENEAVKEEIKQKEKRRKKNAIPPVSIDYNNIKPLLVLTLAVISVFVAFFCWRINQLKRLIPNS